MSLGAEMMFAGEVIDVRNWNTLEIKLDGGGDNEFADGRVAFFAHNRGLGMGKRIEYVKDTDNKITNIKSPGGEWVV